MASRFRSSRRCWHTLLGINDHSCWSRGHAWAIAGFLRGWHEFGEERYRDAAKAAFGYWWDRCGNAPPPWDFDDPDGPVDTSASTIVIEQLARMKVLGVAGADEFIDRLDPIIDGLRPHIFPTGRLVDGCFNQAKEFANRSELIWGTAYLLMALYYLERGSVPC